MNKLVRSSKNREIAGICGDLGEYYCNASYTSRID
jgi:phage shock protein PspC (stress-responsive transcriptional regulator)